MKKAMKQMQKKYPSVKHDVGSIQIRNKKVITKN